MRRRFVSQEISLVESDIITIISGTSYEVPSDCYMIDAFLVGGGGGGGYDGPGGNCGGGGGGGYTGTFYGIKVSPGQNISYSIGKGGASSSNNGYEGGTTSFAGYSVSGGKGGKRYNNGGDGGSGGGGRYGGGGSDGGDGKSSSGVQGIGQHSSTRCPFNNVLYAGGGASGTPGYTIYPGGSGGGADSSGGYVGMNYPEPNTGGGGSGWDANDNMGSPGADGVIVIRLWKKS